MSTLKINFKKHLYLFSFLYSIIFSSSCYSQAKDFDTRLLEYEMTFDTLKTQKSRINYFNYISFSEQELTNYLADGPKLDSLFLSYAEPKDESIFELNITYSKALNYRRIGDFNKAQTGLKEVIKKTSKDRFTKMHFEATNNLARLFARNGDLDSTLYYTNLILNDKEMEIPTYVISDALYFQAMAYHKKGKLNKAASIYITVDSMTTDNPRKKASIYQSLFTLYQDIDDYHNAKIYLHKAIDIGRETHDEYIEYTFMADLAALESEMNHFKSSDSILNIITPVFIKQDQKKFLLDFEIMRGLNQLGLKSPEKSIPFFKRGLSNYPQQIHPIDQIEINQYIARAYYLTQNYQKAEKHLNDALTQCQIIDIVPIKLSLFEEFNKFYLSQKNYQQAYFYLNKLDSLKNTFEKSATAEKINEINISYESEKKEKENALLKVENSTIALNNVKQRQQFIIGGIILLFGLIFLYILYNTKLKSNEKLKELDQLKSKFFESISHELRTPLTLIELPIKKALETDQKIAKDDLKNIKYNTIRLKNLMNDLLSLTKLESKKYPIVNQENNISEQIKILAAQFDSMSDQKKITYNKHIDSKSIIGVYDQEIVQKIITNLLSNAFKYTKYKDRIDFWLECKNNGINIVVKDTGVGIEEKHQKFIFERFYRVEPNSEQIQGSGIGLSLVKDLLNLIHGKIELTSKLGEGATFSVYIPIKNMRIENNLETEDTNNQKAKPLKQEEIEIISTISEEVTPYPIDEKGKPVLLIIEDNEELLLYLKKEFFTKYQVFTASNGEIGIHKALDIIPDIILTDWLMPKKNGIQVCNILKEHELTSHIPIIMLTAKTQIEDKITGFTSGADAYFDKPFDMGVLNSQCSNLLKQRKNLIHKFSEGNFINKKEAFSEKDQLFWDKFQNLVKDNMDNPLFTTQHLADLLFISRMQLNRKIKALTEGSVLQYITRKKIDKAKLLLNTTDISITEISTMLGYESVSSFSRAFKKETKSSPSEFRVK